MKLYFGFSTLHSGRWLYIPARNANAMVETGPSKYVIYKTGSIMWESFENLQKIRKKL